MKPWFRRKPDAPGSSPDQDKTPGNDRRRPVPPNIPQVIYGPPSWFEPDKQPVKPQPEDTPDDAQE